MNHMLTVLVLALTTTSMTIAANAEDASLAAKPVFKDISEVPYELGEMYGGHNSTDMTFRLVHMMKKSIGKSDNFTEDDRNGVLVHECWKRKRDGVSKTIKADLNMDRVITQQEYYDYKFQGFSTTKKEFYEQIKDQHEKRYTEEAVSFFKRNDKNGDGFVDLDEMGYGPVNKEECIINLKDDRATNRGFDALMQCDFDKNGVVTTQEIQIMTDAIIEFADTDKDGEVSHEEAISYRKSLMDMNTKRKRAERENINK